MMLTRRCPPLCASFSRSCGEIQKGAKHKFLETHLSVSSTFSRLRFSADAEHVAVFHLHLHFFLAEPGHVRGEHQLLGRLLHVHRRVGHGAALAHKGLQGLLQERGELVEPGSTGVIPQNGSRATTGSRRPMTGESAMDEDSGTRSRRAARRKGICALEVWSGCVRLFVGAEHMNERATR